MAARLDCFMHSLSCRRISANCFQATLCRVHMLKNAVCRSWSYEMKFAVLWASVGDKFGCHEHCSFMVHVDVTHQLAIRSKNKCSSNYHHACGWEQRGARNHHHCVCFQDWFHFYMFSWKPPGRLRSIYHMLRVYRNNVFINSIALVLYLKSQGS